MEFGFVVGVDDELIAGWLKFLTPEGARVLATSRQFLPSLGNQLSAQTMGFIDAGLPYACALGNSPDWFEGFYAALTVEKTTPTQSPPIAINFFGR